MYKIHLAIRVGIVALLILIAIHTAGTSLHAQHAMPTRKPSSPDAEDLTLQEGASRRPLPDFLRLLPPGKYSSIWQDLIHRLHEEVENSLWTKNLIESSFAFDVDMLRKYRDGILAPDFQIANLSYLLLGSGESRFKITKEALDDLKNEGLPEKIIAYLERLLGQEFSGEHQFLAAVESRIGGEMTLKYERNILEYSLIENFFTLTAPPKSRQEIVLTAYAFQESVKAWNQVLYYPRKFKDFLAFDKGESPVQQQKVQSTVVADEDDFLFRLRKFLKEWGLPRPRTILLIGILIYLTTALIARMSS